MLTKYLLPLPNFQPFENKKRQLTKVPMIYDESHQFLLPDSLHSGFGGILDLGVSSIPEKFYIYIHNRLQNYTSFLYMI